VDRLILKSFQSPGDVVMLTAAVRDLHAACPGRFLTDVRTSAEELWAHNPLLTPLRDDAPGVRTLEMHYPLVHESNERPYHFLHGYVQYLEQQLDLRIPVTRFQGDIPLSDEERELPPPGREAGVPEQFWIVVAGGKYDFTAKWWNPASYQAVIDHFRGKVQFVQCGERGHWHPPLNGVINLIGRTSLREFVRLMHHAEGVLCPVTLAMHLAAAVETRPGRPQHRPCVVIAGGREPPHWEAYPHHQFLSTVGMLSCCADGGCWKSRCQPVGDGDAKDRRNVCEQPVQITAELRIPHCLEMITPEDVIRRIELYYAGDARSYHNGRRESVTDVPTATVDLQTDLAVTSLHTPKSNGRTVAVQPGTTNVLVESRHEADQARDAAIVLRHLQHYYSDWQIDVITGAGDHDVLQSHCRRTFDFDSDFVDRSRYHRVVQLNLQPCQFEYPDWPSTPATRCLLEDLRLTPIPDLYRDPPIRVAEDAGVPVVGRLPENGELPSPANSPQPHRRKDTTLNTTIASDHESMKQRQTPRERLSVSFYHGFGDCSYFAHLIPLYTQRGYDVEVECTPDKALLFEAAGASVIESGALAEHSWGYPAQSTHDVHGRFWQGSKMGHNVSEHPLPDIGPKAELWEEYCDTRIDIRPWLSAEAVNTARRYLEPLRPPIVLLHTKGNTGQQRKSLPDEITLELYRSLIDGFDGTIILLDWDNRVPRLASHRVRHLDDLGECSTGILLGMMAEADLMVGVDSGPLHAARFTSIPTVGLWMPGHYPATYTLPRREQLNVVLEAHTKQWNRYKRIPWNLYEHPGERFDPEIIADICQKMLGAPRYLNREQIAADVQLQQFVRQFCRGRRGNSLSGYSDRNRSFDALLRETSRRFESPTIVETGTIRAEEDWGGAGFFTYLAADYVFRRGGHLHTVDISAESCRFAREWTDVFGSSVSVHQQDSVRFLQSFAGSIDVLVLDSLDTYVPGHAEHAQRELEAALPRLHERSIIVFDDTPWNAGAWTGKGARAVPYLLQRGWSIGYAGYQVVLWKQCHGNQQGPTDAGSE